jgi:integrase
MFISALRYALLDYTSSELRLSCGRLVVFSPHSFGFYAQDSRSRVRVSPPRIKLLKEEGQSALIDKDAESRRLEAAPQPLRDVAILVPDSGMRPSEVFQMRWEDLTWDPGMIFIPRGKTKRSRRHLPMSERVIEALQIRRNGQTQGWCSRPILLAATLPRWLKHSQK